jgi:cytochrome bd ubiquinol oxidase subunit II
MDLNTVWFLLVVVLIAGYAILDGFDLGVGVLHLWARDDTERRINMAAIGPVWDGNEVWLITVGGALFAAFSPVYAAVFSGFYLALVLLLVALIFRAVSLEFRAKIASPVWKRFWDWGFALGSLVAGLLLGVALANVVRGVPIDSEKNFVGTFLGLLNPYALVVGMTGLVMFVMHGAIYMAMKTDGDLQQRMVRCARIVWLVFVVLFAVSTAATLTATPLVGNGLLGRPLFWLFLVVALAGLAAVPLALRAGRYGWAFVASAAVMVALVAVTGVGMYPNLVTSSLGSDLSLTIYNSASTQKTLAVLLVVALIGVPLVLVYTIVVYRLFRGKVTLEPEGY